MKIENPFESGHIKNYILAYVGVVVIMIFFFIAATLWNEPKVYPKKEFAAKQMKSVTKKRKIETNKKSKNVIMLLPEH